MLSNRTATAQELKKQLHEVMTHSYPPGIPGGALLVIKDNQVIIEEGFGVTDLDSKKQITPLTNFRMASVSKQFTAFCILTLAHQRKINLHDPVSKYLTSLPSFASKITIQHLLTHSSGLQDYESLIPDTVTGQVSDADVLNMIRRSDSLYFQPGSRFRYSNGGYCLLTQIVEKVSGISYPDFIHKFVFEPLEMQHTSIMQKEKTIPDRAYGYHHSNSEWKFADQSSTSATMGDGCVYTSLNDYTKWIRSLWSEQLFSFDKGNNPLQPHIRLSDILDYGYGWFTCKLPNGTRCDFHSGESTGFHNIVFHQPAKKLLIVIFSNSDDERISKAFDGVANILKIEWPGKENGISLFDYMHRQYE